MNKIAYIFYLSVIILCFVVIYKIGYNNGIKNETNYNDSTANANVETSKSEGYWIKAIEGEVVVYEEDKKTIVATTDILIENLSKQEQEVLEEGHYFETAEELFSFLETNTS